MSLMQSLMTAAARYMPDREGDPLLDGPGLIGQPIRRVDGSVKARGAARFAAEYKLENMAYASLVCSTICKGKITRLEVSRASAMPGVVAVVSHLNAPRLAKPPMFDPGGSNAGAAGSEPRAGEVIEMVSVVVEPSGYSTNSSPSIIGTTT